MKKANVRWTFEGSAPEIFILRKTKDILINIWLKCDGELREKAFKLVEKYPEDKEAIFWCMLISVYPVFDDICNTMGKISNSRMILHWVN